MAEEQNSTPETAELREVLAAALRSDRPHVERLTLAAAILSTALERAGMEATLVGGSAIEFYAPEAHNTTDLDFVVERGSRGRLGEVFESLGLSKKGRHWVLDDLFVEVPGSWMSDPTETFEVGPFQLRVVRREIVLGERVVGFRYWKAWSHGQQAIAMIRAFRDNLDEPTLRAFLRKEQAEDAYEFLRELAGSDELLDSAALDRLWQARYG